MCLFQLHKFDFFVNDEQILFTLAERKKGTVNIAKRVRERGGGELKNLGIKSQAC